MSTERETHLIPMYQSYSTFTTFLDWLKEMPVMPSQIDRSLWTPKFAGGSGGQLMAGLRFLKLLDGEKPTEKLQELVEADTAHRKQLLAQVLRDAYGDDVIDKLPTMTPYLLNKALDELGATEHTRRKAYSFLVNAARAAELQIAVAIAKKARNKPSQSAVARKSSRRKQDGGKPEQTIDPPSPPAAHRHPDYAAVDALVQQLPPQREWTMANRERWLRALTAAVDWVVTMTNEAHPGPTETANGNKGEAPGSQLATATPGASEGEPHED